MLHSPVCVFVCVYDVYVRVKEKVRSERGGEGIRVGEEDEVRKREWGRRKILLIN